jgi:hypothetical protein
MKSKWLLVVLAAGLMVVLQACEGSSGGNSDGHGQVSISISPLLANLHPGETQQFTATAKDAGGNALSGATFTWSSSNTVVATVNSRGLVTGKGAGTARIAASAEGESASAKVTVKAAPPKINSFTASPKSVNAGDSSILSWDVTGATSLTIDNGVGNVTGKPSIKVMPPATATYILTASSARGSTTASTAVTVCTNQVVNIPDANLKAAIESELGISSDPTCADMQNLTELTAEDDSIQSLKGLQYATNLTKLDLGNTSADGPGNNQISDLSPLSNLTSLTGLLLHDNQIGGIGPLANLTSLTYLDLAGNQISDIQPLMDNSGIGSGDYADISYNCLDLSSGSTDMNDINMLLNRGVNLTYTPQNNCSLSSTTTSTPMQHLTPPPFQPPMPANFMPNAPQEFRTRMWKQMWQHHSPRQP